MTKVEHLSYEAMLQKVWKNGHKIYRIRIPFTEYYLAYFKPFGLHVCKFRISKGFTRRG